MHNPTAMVLADATYTTPGELLRPLLESEDIRASIVLSLVSCTVTTILSLWVAVPIGYLMARKNFFGKSVVDTILDIPMQIPIPVSWSCPIST